MYESIDLGVEFGGIFSEPTINNDNEFTKEIRTTTNDMIIQNIDRKKKSLHVKCRDIVH